MIYQDKTRPGSPVAGFISSSDLGGSDFVYNSHFLENLNCEAPQDLLRHVCRSGLAVKRAFVRDWGLCVPVDQLRNEYMRYAPEVLLRVCGGVRATVNYGGRA